MSTKHTPGPWQVHPYIAQHPHNAARDIGPFGRAVSVVWGPFETRTMDAETEANARLIAAAPQLLKYAKAFEQLITRDSDDLGFHLKLANAAIEDVEGLRAAIAAAEGQL